MRVKKDIFRQTRIKIVDSLNEILKNREFPSGRRKVISDGKVQDGVKNKGSVVLGQRY